MSKIPFDVVFYDVTAYKPYDYTSLEYEPLGGTEATVCRVAQGLGYLGYRVAVIQRPLLNEQNHGNVFYLPEHYLDSIDTKRFVMLRGIKGHELFPKARKYSWQHDLASDKLYTWRDTLIEHDTTVIGVSRWHKTDIEYFLCDKELKDNPKVTFIHNPVEEILYPENRLTPKVNKNKLVWLSSPHKGLGKAIDLFGRLKYITSNDIRLHVYNPGYLSNEIMQHSGVIAHGSTPPKQMWSEIADALCVFYPCQFKETFGLVIAEANALGIPVATYRYGAISEVISGEDQIVPYNDEINLLKKVEQWYSGYRPTVTPRDEFRLSNIVQKWDFLLKAKSI